jgi:hypothetical protein
MVLINIEEKNFKNVIYIHKNKLKRIMSGSNPYKLFTSKERNRLVSDNVLKEGVKGYIVTKKALKFLSEI